jgi:hypothetical protein
MHHVKEGKTIAAADSVCMFCNNLVMADLTPGDSWSCACLSKAVQLAGQVALVYLN